MSKNWIKQLILGIVIIAGTAQTGRADNAPAPPPPPKWYDTIGVSGFVDAYYSYNFLGSGPGGTIRTNAYHNFDMTANSLNLSLVELNIVKPVDDKNKAGFYIGLAFGEAADVIACGGGLGTVTPANCFTGGSNEAPSKNLRQAYASMLLLPGLQLDFGKYVTQMGAEVIESKDNWNYTRSLLYTLAIPYLHSGARLTYTVNDMVYVQGQIDNGWNNSTENNNGKYYGIQLGVTPIKPLPIVINYAESSEPTVKEPTGDGLSLFDIIVTYNVTDSLSFMANYDNATQKSGTPTGDAKWDGYALYGRYQITPNIAGVIRFEQFNDDDGFRTGINYANGGQKLTEETVTLEHNSLAGCLVRLEYRHDSTNASDSAFAFVKNDGTGTTSQDTLTLGVVHTF